MLKIYANTNGDGGKIYTIVRDNIVYKYEVWSNKRTFFNKLGTVGDKYCANGMLVRKPSKKFVIIIQNLIKSCQTKEVCQ